MLNNLETYSNNYKLKINTNKSKIMIFEKGNRHSNDVFTIYNQPIETVNSFKYLGVTLYKNGSWNRTVKHISDQAQKSLSHLFSILNKFEFSINEKCNLFDTLVKPMLNYCSEIWGYNEGKCLELIHTKFCRKILNVRKSTNISALYGELGRIPLQVERKINMIKYWIHIVNSEDTNLIKIIFNMQRHDVNTNQSKTNWAYRIKTTLCDLGMHDLWVHQNRNTIRIEPIKQRIIDQFKQLWHTQINNSQRLKSYCRFKNTFELETYLDKIQIKKYRISLTKFRLSSHDLEVEKGRFLNIDRENRKCKLCNTNKIENEYHFLLVCPLYNDIRKKYFKRYFCSWPTLHKFDTLMQYTNTAQLLKLAKYIHDANILRQSTLDNL